MKANVYTEIDSVYISQIKRFPLLSANEESELAHRISQGDRAALEKLVNSNLRLVITVALRFAKLSAPLMDLIQEGNMGLITAAHKFNGRYGTRFSTYAYPWIVQYMIRYMKTRVAAIVIPNRKDAMLKAMHKAREELTLENGEAPTNSELAEFMGISESALRSLLQYDFSVSSLDVEVGESDKGTSLGDLIPDTTFSPEEQYMIREEKEGVKSLLDALPSNESKVLWYRFNFACDEKQKTLRDLSTIFGISPEAIRQTEIRAIRHLRRNVAV